MLVFVHVHASPEHSVHSIHAILCNLFSRQHSSISKTKWKFRIIMYGSALFIWNLLLDIPLFHVFSQTGNCWQQLPVPYKRPSIIPSTDVIQLTLTLKMTTAQVVETSVTVNNNSPIQDYVHPDDQTQPTFWNDSWVQNFHNKININVQFGGRLVQTPPIKKSWIRPMKLQSYMYVNYTCMIFLIF